MDTNRSQRSPIIGGIVLIVLGLFFFAQTQGFALDLGKFLPDWNLNLESIWPGLDWGVFWPVILLAIGVVVLVGAALGRDAETRIRRARSGCALVVLGLFFFAATNQWIPWALWPVLLMLAGGLLLFAPRNRRAW